MPSKDRMKILPILTLAAREGVSGRCPGSRGAYGGSRSSSLGNLPEADGYVVIPHVQ
jgi:hypothetical protein